MKNDADYNAGLETAAKLLTDKAGMIGTKTVRAEGQFRVLMELLTDILRAKR